MFSLSENTKKLLSAGLCVHSLFIGLILASLLLSYLLTTRCWCIAVLSIAWTYYDRKTGEQGGRPFNWVQNKTISNYNRNYFPSKLITPPNFSLNAKRNYMFCSFPHGILPTGAFNNIFLKTSDFRRLFPDFNVRFAVLHWLLFVPFMREYILAFGAISCSASSLNYFLNNPYGGHVLILTPGGAMEAYNVRPGQYKFIVKNRKGFIKIALKNGASLVPAITFGENDIFSQVENKKLRILQIFLKKKLGFAVPLFYGRGIGENSLGPFPRKKPLTTVLGTPIDVDKIENPSSQQVDELHAGFTEELVKLFDQYKYTLLENASDCCLVLE